MSFDDLIVFLDVNPTQILNKDLNYDLILQLWKKKNSMGGLVLNENRKMHVCCASKGYKSPYDEDGAENVILEGEQSQTHVGEDEILSQEVKDLKELHGKHNIHHEFSLGMYEYATGIQVKIFKELQHVSHTVLL